MTVSIELFCRIYQSVRSMFTSILPHVNNFSILFDNYKVVGYEVTFLFEKYQNFGPSELNIPKKRSNSAAVFT